MFHCWWVNSILHHKQFIIATKLLLAESINIQRWYQQKALEEKGKNVTVLFCCLLVGSLHFLFVYPRQRTIQMLKISAPLKNISKAKHKEWMNIDLFLNWMRYFYKYTDPLVERPVLLVLDEYVSHKTFMSLCLHVSVTFTWHLSKYNINVTCCGGVTTAYNPQAPTAW